MRMMMKMYNDEEGDDDDDDGVWIQPLRLQLSSKGIDCYQAEF